MFDIKSHEGDIVNISRRGWVGLLLLAALGLWLLLGSGRVFGVDLGAAGVPLLLVPAWIALYGISTMPGPALENAVSPGEWKAWIGLAFMLAAALYFLAKLPLLVGESLPGAAPHATAVARNLVLLLIAWIVLSHGVASRWKHRVQEDERDREIARRAGDWGRGALVVAVVAVAVLLGFSPPDRLQWATHFLVGNLLLFALVVAWLVEQGASVAMYWRDRR